VNHAKIATQALRYRFNAVRGSLAHPSDWELENMANFSVSAAEPAVDAAIRQLATEWVRFGLDTEDLIEPWDHYRIDQLFQEHPDLIDALDDIVRVATRPQAA
jgi:hypothetical protein